MTPNTPVCSVSSHLLVLPDNMHGFIKKLFLTVLTGLCVSAAVVVFVDRQEYAVLWFLVSLIFFVALTPIIIEIHEGRFDLFNLRNGFVCYFLMQFGVWPVWAFLNEPIRNPYIPFVVRVEYEYWVLALFYALIGIFFFHLGYYGRLGKLVAAKLPYINDRMPEVKLWIVIIPLLVIATLSVLSLAFKAGGFAYFITHIDEFRTKNMLGNGYLFFGIDLLSIAYLIFAVYVTPTHKYNFLNYLFLAVAMCVSMAVGFRHMLFYLVIYFVITRNYLYKRISFKKVLSLILILIPINMVYALFRGFAYLGLVNMFSSISFDYTLFYNTLLARFHGAESLVRIIKGTRIAGFQYGLYFLRDLIIYPIPRMFWPDKPLSSGMIQNVLFWGDIFTGKETGTAVPTFIGELYWICGLLGIIFGMFLMGAFLRTMYSYMTSCVCRSSVAIYANAFWFAIFVNETLSLHTLTFISSLFVIIALLLYIGSFRIRIINN